jgi:hypothetical protein
MLLVKRREIATPVTIHMATIIDKNNHVFILASDAIPLSTVRKLITPKIHKTIVISIKTQNPPVSLVLILISFNFIINNLLNDCDSSYYIALFFPFLRISSNLSNHPVTGPSPKSERPYCLFRFHWTALVAVMILIGYPLLIPTNTLYCT